MKDHSNSAERAEGELMKTIDPQILSQLVDGVNLKPGTLSDQINPARPTLLVFLRHFG
jgi:hypothetical protein